MSTPPDPDAPFNKMQECRYGTMVYNVNDMYIGRSLELYGEYSEGECKVFRQLLDPGSLVVDVGANIGTHTLFFAKTVGPTGTVLAFEPQRLLFQTLCANMAINSIDNVWAFNYALGETRGFTKVAQLNPRATQNFGALSLRDAQPGDQTAVMKLDELEIPNCRLIKLDVEGMELGVLKGAVGVIRRYMPALYVEADREANRAELLDFIASLDYEMYWHVPRLFNPKNFRNNSENVFENTASFNVLCTPPGVHHIIGLNKVDRSAMPTTVQQK